MTETTGRFSSTRPPEGRRQRVRVTSPRTSSGRRHLVSITSEIDSQTPVGDLYVQSLVRSQLRLALTVVAVLAVTLGGLPLLFTLVPSSRHLALGGIPLAWLVLGALVYPGLVLVGWVYVRQAERNEDDFTDLVLPSSGEPDPEPRGQAELGPSGASGGQPHPGHGP